MFPVDVVALLREGLLADRREPDGKLHCSSHLIGSLRHAMLDVAGAPKIESELVSDIRLMTGTMWHRYIEQLLHDRGIKVETEINVTPGLPEGWSGTADWLFWSQDHEAWVLGDLKTMKGEGIKWVNREGAKLEHMWQLSAYFWALVDMGFPMVKGFGVLYLPMNDTTDRDDNVEPTLQECEPLPREVVWGQMEARRQMVDEYLAAIDAERERWAQETGEHPMSYPTDDDVLNDKLAPEQDRVQKVYWNKARGVFDVKLVPHWSADYCPFPNELCACSEQGTTKIGEWVFRDHYDGDPFVDYITRKGYDEYDPQVSPSARDIHKRWKELNAGEAEAAIRPEGD